MASLTVRRLSTLCRLQTLRPSGAALFRVDAMKPQLINNQRSLILGLSPTSYLSSRQYATAAPASAEEVSDAKRETSPNLESSATRRSYLGTLRDGGPIHWIPAHWVTTIYNELLGSNQPGISVSPENALLLLKCFDARLAEETPENRVKMAEKAWQDLKASGTSLDIRHYNALLEVYLSNNHAFDPEDFLMILSEDGVAMNKESYHLFVKRYCQTGNVSDAMRILEFMKSKGMKMNRPLFHALISGHILSGDVTGSNGLMEMVSRAYKVQSEDFIPAIVAQARMGNVEKVLESFIEMKTQSLAPDVGEVLSVLTAYVDWCLAENKYPESSALDSLCDTLRGGRPMSGLHSVVCQNVIKLQTCGFHDVAAEVLACFPNSNLAARQFFKCAVRTLPFSDVIRYCESVGKAHESDPMTEYCLPEIGLLPYALLQQVLIDAKESEFPVETITAIVSSKFGAETTQRSRGHQVEQAALLAVQLELPIVKDLDFWATRATLKDMSFDTFYKKFHKAGSEHDQKMIAECKPTMILGYVKGILGGNRLDRLKVAADLLRTEPDLEVRRIDKVLVGTSVTRRLRYKNSREVHLPEAFYLLKRFEELSGDRIGRLLKQVVSSNPDPDLIASIVDHAKAEDASPSARLIGELLNQTSNPDVQAVFLNAMEDSRKNYLETAVLERMTLEELLDYGDRTTGIFPLSFMVCRKACLKGNEDVALDALSKVGQSSKLKSLVEVVGMYVNVLGDGFKALEYVDVLLSNSSHGVELPTNTFLRLIEILLKNGRSLADLHLVDELAQSRIKLVSPFGERDRRVVSDHVAFISNLDEDQAAIESYINRLMASNLSSTLTDFYIEWVLKKDGVKEAVEIVKSYFNADHNPLKGSIPNEESLLDAIVASEDVAILKEYLDLSYVVHGERNAFLNLALALYKGGKYAQGKRILNIPGLRSDDGIVTNFCEKMLREKRFEALETFCSDVCCIYGVDKADLAFYKLRSLMAKGDKLKALEYFNDLINKNEPSNDKLKQQAAYLYSSVNIEYFDRAVVARDYNAASDSSSPFDGNISEVLRNIESGTEYPLEFYHHLIGTVLADDPSHVYKALIEGKNTFTLEQLAQGNSSANSHLALAYIRENRLEDLLKKCREAEKPEEYLTTFNLQLIRSKVDPSEWISKIQTLAEERASTKLIANLVNYHFSVSDLETAKTLMDKHPDIENFQMIFVNSYSVLENITKLETSNQLRASAFHRLIHNGVMMNMPFFVKRSIDQLLESGVQYYASAKLRSQVKRLLGVDPFKEHKKSETEETESPEDVLGLETDAEVLDAGHDQD